MTTCYNLFRRFRTTRLVAMAGAIAALTLPFSDGQAQSTNFMIQRPTPGGIDPRPYINSIVDTQNLVINWFGFEAPYQLQGKSAIDGTTWTNIGGSTTATSASVPKHGNTGFLRVQGTSPPYVGVTTDPGSRCAECHSGVHTGWGNTAHANAFQTLKNINQQNNAACLACHTVGFGVPTGFVNEATTPEFANVQCENCHGPSGNHVAWADAGGLPPKVVPVTTRSAMLCGGCHNGFHHPTYDEWNSSPHSVVIETLANDFSSTNRTAAVSRMNQCGACHSGAVRLEMLQAYAKTGPGQNRTNVVWPSGFDATNTPITCVVCHDSHSTRKYTNVITGTIYTNQLRNPLTSTNFFSYNTGTNFAANYNANVSICGQCHNARGASVTGTSRPPHHSPQYNILLGNIGITTNAAPPQGAHRNAPHQCASCHTHRHGEENPTPDDPVYTGHSFRPHIEACMVCHTNATGPMSATNLLFTVQSEISATISTTKNMLDLWASTKNTNSWAANYEQLGWEFTTPGSLSNPTGSSSVRGPTTAEQAQIPQNIKDARFNLYLIAYDQSLGIHNTPYARYLLDVAQQKVNVELNRP